MIYYTRFIEKKIMRGEGQHLQDNGAIVIDLKPHGQSKKFYKFWIFATLSEINGGSRLFSISVLSFLVLIMAV